jgi:hypothetical protein
VCAVTFRIESTALSTFANNSMFESQVIMDPNLDWDKNFLSPASSKTSKSTLEDKATFWKAPESIQINTYIKAKSNKNSSRRKNVHKSEV